jgi:hypothetical protein
MVGLELLGGKRVSTDKPSRVAEKNCMRHEISDQTGLGKMRA